MRIALKLLLILFIGVGAAAAYNLIAARRLAARNPIPGNSYDVNGRPMHIYCAGSGSPIVVLEGGLGRDWWYWQRVQPEVAKSTRACSYDRAGLGWSELQHGARDAQNIAAQLHSLLRQAGEKPPFVLVGASAGGLYMRQFYADHPAEVAGIVFVDSSMPEQVQALPHGKDTAAARRKRHQDATWDWIKEASGWARLTGKCKGDVEPQMKAFAAYADAETCRPSYTRTWLGEWDDFWRSADEVSRLACCGDLPLLVISQDPDRPKPGWDAASLAANPIWASLQENLKKLSPRTRRVIARGSGHHVMVDRPEVIIDGIRGMVGEIRGGRSDASYGTTVVQ